MKHPLEFERQGNLIIIRLTGELTSYLLDTLKQDLAARIQETKTTRVLINLSAVEYIASKDLSVFLQILLFMQKESKKKQHSEPPILAFSNLNEFVMEIMRITRLEKVFQVFPTEEEAIAVLVTKETDTES